MVRWFVLLSIVLVISGCLPSSSVPPTSPGVSQSASKPPAAETKPEPPPQPAEPPAIEDITWERLDIGMEPDSVYQPWMMKTSIKVLEGKPVRIKGFMNGAVFTRTNIRNFHLMREKECPFGPGGQAHHAIEVEMQGKARVNFTTEEITVEGIFSIAPFTGENGKTWSLYRIEATAAK
jgi:hypothetical protein